MRQAGDKVKVFSEMERADYLLEQVGGMEADLVQLNLPGMDVDSDGLTAIDRLHLLVVLDRRGALTGGLIPAGPRTALSSNWRAAWRGCWTRPARATRSISASPTRWVGREWRH